MAKHNYSQYSNNKNNKVDIAPENTEEIQNGVVTDIVNEEVATTITNTVEGENTEATVETTVDATVKTETETTKETNSGAVTKGVVAKCAKLNVRSESSTSADVVTVLNAGDEVTIDVDKSTKEWFKIRTANGVKGYCMRKFVNANI